MIKKIHPSYYGLILFSFMILLFVAYQNLGRDMEFLRETAFCLFPLMLILGIVGVIKAKKWLHYGLSVFSILLGGLFSFSLKNVFVHGYAPHESIASVILGGNYTVWAEGYSKSNFSRVKAGMSEAEVLELLGDPLVTKEHRNNYEWFYSTGPDGRTWAYSRYSTHVRRIVFRSTRVIGTESFFYID